MSDILEKSLDDIIGESKPARRSGSSHSYHQSRRGGSGPIHHKNLSRSRIHKPYERLTSRSSIPAARPNSTLSKDIQALAGSRPVLRVKNIHPDLNGEDLSNLFGNVSPVDFVKFDNRNDDIAYVCFHNDNSRSNAEAIEKYNGKKAMGQILSVENASSLAERIKIVPVSERIKPRPTPAHFSRDSRGPRESRDSKPKPKPAGRERKPKPTKKSLDDLDEELNAYMNSQAREAEYQSSEADTTNQSAINSQDITNSSQPTEAGDDSAMLD
ncbi:uncharacterized protein RJT21DRAFT_117675 [Scheffersomyces amazonensis]|uniref:uncharacterized protein n=1 Tax=Scheffersomyces amazonensis TaxID=1078765 RepID=UPI00315D3EA1